VVQVGRVAVELAEAHVDHVEDVRVGRLGRAHQKIVRLDVLGERERKKKRGERERAAAAASG